jgi:hypothetical protein
VGDDAEVEAQAAARAVLDDKVRVGRAQLIEPRVVGYYVVVETVPDG